MATSEQSDQRRGDAFAGTRLKLCVAGASGLVGANITREALARGYRVNGTLRDSTDPDKAPFLQALPGAGEPGTDGLTLFDADMANATDFDEPVAGCDCVFIACLIPTYAGPDGKAAREMEDDEGYEQIVRPTLDGCMNILHSARSAGLSKVVICSSTSSTNPVPAVANKNEVDHWSDEHVQYRAKKYTSAAKTVMEKAAMKFADDNGIRLSIVLPTLMLGPAVIPGHATRGFLSSLADLVKGEPGRHAAVPNDSSSMIHLHDLANLFMAVYENPDARGRYFGVYDSWHWQDIYAVLHDLLPETPMPTELKDAQVTPTSFDFARRDSLGVPVRAIPEILRDTVEWCQESL
jgi:nucleoside-diphosphate-sugar epimerase